MGKEKIELPNPKYLIELKTRAEKALNSEPPDGLTGFTSVWALWEAVRRRILILACKREGWTVQQARDALFHLPGLEERGGELGEVDLTPSADIEGDLRQAAESPGADKAGMCRRRHIMVASCA